MANLLTENKVNNSHKLLVEEPDVGLRLDKFLAEKLPDFSRSRLKALLGEGNLKRGKEVFQDASYKVKLGEHFTLEIPPAKPSEITAKEIPLDIVYEDDSLLVINKQAGLTVHPGAGNHNDTLVNALLAHCKGNLSGIGGVERPGIVHRLDKDTSGLMVVAKDDNAHKSLAKQIESRGLKRIYLAVVWNVPNPYQGTIDANIGRSKANRKKMAIYRMGGKTAVTHYKVVENYGDKAALVECQLETGRTHQIRVHLTHKGNPLIGDKAYGTARKKTLAGTPEEIKNFVYSFPRQALHSYKIAFTHPKTKKKLKFETKIPEDIQSLIKALNKLQKL